MSKPIKPLPFDDFIYNLDKNGLEKDTFKSFVTSVNMMERDYAHDKPIEDRTARYQNEYNFLLNDLKMEIPNNAGELLDCCKDIPRELVTQMRKDIAKNALSQEGVAEVANVKEKITASMSNETTTAGATHVSQVTSDNPSKGPEGRY